MARQFGLQAVCSYYCQPLGPEVTTTCAGPYHWTSTPTSAGIMWGWLHPLAGSTCAGCCAPAAHPTLSIPARQACWVFWAMSMLPLRSRPNCSRWRSGHRTRFLSLLAPAGPLPGCSWVPGWPVWRAASSGVRIIEKDVANRPKIARMVNRTARYLRRREPSIPQIEIGPDDVELLDDYLGPGYAHPTDGARHAAELRGPSSKTYPWRRPTRARPWQRSWTMLGDPLQSAYFLWIPSPRNPTWQRVTFTPCRNDSGPSLILPTRSIAGAGAPAGTPASAGGDPRLP